MLADEVSKMYAVLNTIFPNDSSKIPEYIRGLPIDSVAVPEEVTFLLCINKNKF